MKATLTFTAISEIPPPGGLGQRRPARSPRRLIAALPPVGLSPLCLREPPTFKIVHRRGADRAQNYLALIEHRELNEPWSGSGAVEQGNQSSDRERLQVNDFIQTALGYRT
jgi:hypothetical protein